MKKILFFCLCFTCCVMHATPLNDLEECIMKSDIAGVKKYLEIVKITKNEKSSLQGLADEIIAKRLKDIENADWYCSSNGKIIFPDAVDDVADAANISAGAITISIFATGGTSLFLLPEFSSTYKYVTAAALVIVSLISIRHAYKTNKLWNKELKKFRIKLHQDCNDAELIKRLILSKDCA